MKRILVAACLLLMILSPSAFAERPGDTVYISVKKLPVHQKPDGYSPVVTMLSFGNKVKALQFLEYTSLPESTQPPAWKSRRVRELNKLKEKDRALDRPKIKKLEKEIAEGIKIPTWIKIQGGYIHYLGTVPQHKWQDQTEKKAKDRVKEWAITKGKKNFSENENSNDDLIAMKGIAGKAMASGPDYRTLDTYVAACQCYDFYNEYGKFRENGELGEYKKD